MIKSASKSTVWRALRLYGLMALVLPFISKGMGSQLPPAQDNTATQVQLQQVTMVHFRLHVSPRNMHPIEGSSALHCYDVRAWGCKSASLQLEQLWFIPEQDCYRLPSLFASIQLDTHYRMDTNQVLLQGNRVVPLEGAQFQFHVPVVRLSKGILPNINYISVSIESGKYSGMHCKNGVLSPQHDTCHFLLVPDRHYQTESLGDVVEYAIKPAGSFWYESEQKKDSSGELTLFDLSVDEQVPCALQDAPNACMNVQSTPSKLPFSTPCGHR